jgi:PAS domain S-box-containing protein
MATRLKVLAVDDSEDDALLLAREFRKGGLDAEFTRLDTEAALRTALAQQHWDIVLCDFSMPHFNGMTALRVIREVAPDLPIIFVSGTVGEDVAVEAMRAGANDYLMKDHLTRLAPAVERELQDAVVRVARKRAEEALRQNEVNLQLALEAGGLGDWHWNIVTGEVIWSPRCKALYGLPADTEMTYERFLAVLHPDDRPLVEAALKRAVAERTDYEIEKRVLWPDGSLHWTASRGRVFLDAQGRPLHMTGVTMDITERRRAEAALRESEGKFRSVAETSPVGIMIHQDGRCRYVNAVFEAVTGWTRDELLGMDFWAMVHPDFQAVVRERGLARSRGEPAPAQYEFKIVTKTGEELWTEVRATGLEFEGRPAVLATLFDITKRKQAEEALRRSERRKTILNQILSVLVTVPDDAMYGRVLAIVLENLQSRLGIFGFVAENGDLIVPSMSREVWDQCQVADRSLVFPPASWGEALWGKAILERRSFMSDGPFRVPKGHLHIDHFLTTPIVFGEATIGLLSVANGDRSYTEEDRELLESIASNVSPILNARLQRDRQEEKRKRAEDKLRKLSRAVDQSPVSIIITDTAGKIEYVNPKFTEVSGYALAEVLGQNPRLLKSGESPREEYQRLWETIQAGREWRGEFHNRKKSGALYWELASISPIVDAAGKITHFLAVKEDITERKRLEEEFRQAQKLEAIGQLAGGVAHDFNNILAAILMHLGLLQTEEDLTPSLTAALKELEVEATRAANLTRQLLLFSRRQVLEARPLDLNDVVNNMTKLLRRLIGEDIELSLHGQRTGAWALADAGMMDQVLLNLCVNARDAMPKGGKLTIDTQRVDVTPDRAAANAEAQPGPHVCLSVSDTGCGMDEEILKHIFEPFFTTKEPGKGTGLGLATVYGIVKQHHGWVEVETAPGAGTSFRVFLPSLPETNGSRETPEPIEAPGGTETILLVEDDQSLRRLTALGLRKLGYAVLEASNGVDAIAQWVLNRDRVHMLFTDMIMPGGITGVDLAERCLKEKPALKVIVASGYAAERSKPTARLGQGIVFLPKPYGPVGLANLVRASLDRPSSPPPA